MLLWPASGFLIALLLHASRQQWPILLALAALGSAGAAALGGLAPEIVGGIALAHAGEGWLAARLLKRRKQRESDLLREWLADAGAIAVIAPLAGAVFLAGARFLASGAVPLEPLANHVLAHSIGNLVFFPFFGMIVSGELADWAEKSSMRRRADLAGFLVVLAGTGFWAVWQMASSASFLPLLAPILVALLATCRFGMPAASLSAVVLALSVWGAVAAGFGPAAAAPETAGGTTQFLQFYLALAVFCLQPLARHLTQNRRLAFALLQKDLSGNDVELSLQAKDFQIGESKALYRLLAENMTDLVGKTDREGYVLYASPSLERHTGLHPAELVSRHILDLIHPSYGASFMSGLEQVLASGEDSAWAEYLGVSSAGEDRWFDTQIRHLPGTEDDPGGAVIVLRSIEERKALEQQLFAATLTDPLTNLTNRRAFNSMLQYHIDVPIEGCLAIFDIDDFRLINREHGHAVGDKVLTTVAKLLRALLRKSDIISRIGGERFAVLLSQATPDQAEMLCQRVVRTLSEASGSGPRITVSAGVSRIEGSLDDTMKRADAAVVVAKAKGRNRLEMETGKRLRWSPEPFDPEG